MSRRQAKLAELQPTINPAERPILLAPGYVERSAWRPADSADDIGSVVAVLEPRGLQCNHCRDNPADEEADAKKCRCKDGWFVSQVRSIVDGRLELEIIDSRWPGYPTRPDGQSTSTPADSVENDEEDDEDLFWFPETKLARYCDINALVYLGKADTLAEAEFEDQMEQAARDREDLSNPIPEINGEPDIIGGDAVGFFDNVPLLCSIILLTTDQLCSGALELDCCDC